MAQRLEPVAWRQARWIDAALAITGCVLIVCTLTLAWRAWFGTRDATARTVSDLRATNTELAHARADLDHVMAEVAAAREALGDDLVLRGAHEATHDAAAARLDDAQRVLAAAKARLNGSNTDLVERSAGLDALNRCLRGTSEALNQASVGDVRGMVTSIDRVAAVCDQAAAGL
jgi:hypothetical protein